VGAVRRFDEFGECVLLHCSVNFKVFLDCRLQAMTSTASTMTSTASTMTSTASTVSKPGRSSILRTSFFVHTAQQSDCNVSSKATDAPTVSIGAVNITSLLACAAGYDKYGKYDDKYGYDKYGKYDDK
jgi:hypothetical protein